MLRLLLLLLVSLESRDKFIRNDDQFIKDDHIIENMIVQS